MFLIAATPLGLPARLPSIEALPADVKSAVPTLTEMTIHGGVNVLIAIAILIAGWVMSRWLARWLKALFLHSRHIDETLKPLMINFARYGVIAITLVVVLGQFGVQTTSLIALLGAAGLAIGLALQGTMSNVASGVMLLVLQPFRVADKIVAGTVTGTVREIGLFHTELVTNDGVFVAMPNSVIFSGTIVNLSREPLRRTNFPVDIDRDSDITAAQSAILEAMARDSRVLKQPAPLVLVATLSGSQVLLNVHVWVMNRDFLAVESDLRVLVRRTLNEAGFGPPVPVPPPSVAPWTPPAEQKPDNQANKPN
ncbi:MAG TPA: mechanosensitive ion channel domain-containing protein [Rhizomicrobium sp.]|nr:mechanosensitive ion channel domain-containing protein [Rhizomicrobium sp.]